MSVLKAVFVQRAGNGVEATFTIDSNADLTSAAVVHLSFWVPGTEGEAPMQFGVKIYSNDKPSAYVSRVEGSMTVANASEIQMVGNSIIVHYPDASLSGLGNGRLMTASASVDHRDVQNNFPVMFIG